LAQGPPARFALFDLIARAFAVCRKMVHSQSGAKVTDARCFLKNMPTFADMSRVTSGVGPQASATSQRCPPGLEDVQPMVPVCLPPGLEDMQCMKSWQGPPGLELPMSRQKESPISRQTTTSSCGGTFGQVLDAEEEFEQDSDAVADEAPVCQYLAVQQGLYTVNPPHHVALSPWAVPFEPSSYPQDALPSRPMRAISFCTSCGQHRSSYSKFCSRCGVNFVTNDK